MKIRMLGIKTRVAISTVLQIVLFIAIAGAIMFNQIEGETNKKDILLYLNEDVRELEDLVKELKVNYEKITMMSTKSDSQIYNNIQNEILPKSSEIIELAKSIEIENKDIREIHNMYIDALNKQHEALEIYAEALEDGDNEDKLGKLLLANGKTMDAKIRMRDYQMSTLGLAEEYGLTF